jgi:translation initiation factor IF-2
MKNLFVVLTVRAISPVFFHWVECKPAIPVSHINIGPIYKKDVMRANIMNEKNLPEFATILAFDVKVDSEAQSFADENKVHLYANVVLLA